MRNSEFLIVSTHSVLLQDLLRSVCSEILGDNSGLSIGFLPLDDQYQAHLYGIVWDESGPDILWDRLCSKAVGVLILFDWRRPESVKMMREIVDFFDQKTNLPLMVASVRSGDDASIPFKLYRGGLSLSSKARFSLYEPQQIHTVKELFVGLINISMERLEV